MLEDRSNTKAISTALSKQSPGAAKINFKSFKTDKAKVEFYFNSYSQKTEMLAHIGMTTATKGTSNLKEALILTK
jgi:hypothetical protein